jgi:DNA processing protein
LLRAELEACEKLGVSLVSILDDEYPALLAKITVPPPLLFVRGKLPVQNQPMLAVVGARKADMYGKRCVVRILPELVSRGWAIVSGGAAGIDSFAHQVALDQGGSTVVVVGCGLNHVYPEKNKQLFELVVAKGGALISIFPMNTPPSRQTFPIRNRVIAGLCVGTLVVQAAKESGSLITAKYALDENREVLAVPGPVDSSLSEGCHELLRSGARLTATTDDIFAAFEFFENVNLSPMVTSPVKIGSSVKNNESAVFSAPECKDPKSIILGMLATPKTNDDLARETGFLLSLLIDLLFELELDGLVVQHFNGTWERS